MPKSGWNGWVLGLAFGLVLVALATLAPLCAAQEDAVPLPARSDGEPGSAATLPPSKGLQPLSEQEAPLKWQEEVLMRPAATRPPIELNVEWLALHLSAGMTFGGGVSFFTLRWHYFVWELLRGEFQVAYNGNTNPRYGNMFAAGSAFGFPFYLDPAKQHELRLETGIFAGIWECGSRHCNGDGSQCFCMNVGPFIMAEASYLYHYSEHVVFLVGLMTFFPGLQQQNGVPQEFVYPFITANFGMRF